MTAAGLWTVALALVYTAWLVVGGRIPGAGAIGAVLARYVLS